MHKVLLFGYPPSLALHSRSSGDAAAQCPCVNVIGQNALDTDGRPFVFVLPFRLPTESLPVELLHGRRRDAHAIQPMRDACAA